MDNLVRKINYKSKKIDIFFPDFDSIKLFENQKDDLRKKIYLFDFYGEINSFVDHFERLANSIERYSSIQKRTHQTFRMPKNERKIISCCD